MPTPRLSPEVRKAKLNAAQAALVSSVETITSGDDWKNYLAFSAQLPNYSARNCFWLEAQIKRRGWEGPGYIASYRKWESLDRQVRKGERGLQVLAPLRFKIEGEDDEPDRSVLRGFKVETVFSSHQTDGEGGIPEPLRAVLLTGKGPEGAWDRLVGLIEEEGFSVCRKPLAPENGVTNFDGKTVVVAERLEGAAAVKTLAHELAHVLLHAPEKVDYLHNRGRLECEAESTAFMALRK